MVLNYIQSVLVVPGPNRTVDTILKESVLINVFRNSHLTLEKNLVLNYLSTHHSEPDMAATYSEIQTHMNEHKPYKFIPGRRSAYAIGDMFEKGIRALLSGNVEDTDGTGATAAAADMTAAGDDIEGEDEEAPAADVDSEMHPDMADVSVDLDLN